MGTKALDGALFERLVAGGAANLGINARVVNDLNVFPIPDGDTGDNMRMTIDGGVRSLTQKPTANLFEASRILARGMLMSARGNSGVILSQFFAGIADGFSGVETADVTAVGHALRMGVKSAYASVVTPTEGTILTVMREAVEYACERITPESTLESFNTDALAEMERSLQRTPELLAVLKEAGVIDSGGAGLFYIADGVNRTLNGEMPVESAVPAAPSAPDAPDLSLFDENSSMLFGYCTEFLLRLTHAKTDIDAFSLEELIAYLETVGDSIVAVRNGTVVKIHVHTMTPETVLAHCHAFGEFLTIKIENMTLQHHEMKVDNRFDSKPRKPFGLVTVASGPGIRETFSDLGADVVIDGGQGKNPSTEDFLSAFEKVGAETIFVLPNNGNIVMAAKQAASLCETARVIVVESKNIGEGYAALTMLSYDSGDADEIAATLKEAMEGVVTGMVTAAVRETTVDGVAIKADDYIGFTDKHMLVSEPTALAALEALTEKLNIDSREYVIAVYGADVPEADKAVFRNYMKSGHRRTELCEIDGGQEIYHYLLILG